MANLPVENANLQAQAVVASEGASSVSSVIRDLEKLESKPEIKKTEWMQKLLEVGGTKDLTGQLLKDLVTKVAQAGVVFEGITPQSKVESKTQESKDNFKLNQEEFSDQVDLSGKAGEDRTLPIRGIGQKASQLKQEIAMKWQEIEERLLKEGKTQEEISRLELQFKQSEGQKHLLNLLRDSAILYYLDSDSKVRTLIRQRGFAELVSKAGRELGREAAVEAQAEVRGFVQQELENQLILRTFLQDGEFKDCYQLVKIGDKVGFDSLGWMENVWPDKKGHHGLSLLDVPHEVTGYVNLKDTDSQSRREREKFEYKEEDEKDLVLNRLRALYMQLILRPGALESLTTWFKVRKLKNGLIRLGVYTRDMDEKVQSEAKTLAKLKTMEMLEEALHERATFFDQGPAKDLIDNKVKNCLKNLERLGFDLSPDDFIVLRDKANRHIYGLAQRELEATKDKKGPKAEKKVERLQKLLARLQKESNLGLRPLAELGVKEEA